MPDIRLGYAVLGCEMLAPGPSSLSWLPLTYGKAWGVRGDAEEDLGLLSSLGLAQICSSAYVLENERKGIDTRRKGTDTRRKPRHLQRLLKQAL
jgi:hypothetical protein